MSQKHNLNEEVPMEKLFQEALENHSEAVTEHDADLFLSQLEDTGYFNESINWTKPIYWSLAVLTVAGVLVSLFYFNQKSSNDTTVNKAERIINEVKNSAVPASDQNANESTAKAFQELEKRTTVSAKDNKPQSTSNAAIGNDVDIVVPTNVVIADSPKQDTVTAVPALPKKKAIKDSVRVRYVMAVDTIKSVDSLNINKRKYQKMKEKSK